MSLSAKLGSLALGASGAQRCRALRCPPAAAAAPAARPRSVCVRAAVDVVAEEEDGPDAGRRRRPAPAGPGGREGGGRDGGPRKPREKPEFEERVVQVSRVVKVVKGGKQLSFRAVVVIGNKKGAVGVGVAKAKEVVVAVQKAVTDAKKTLSLVPITAASSVPHKLTVQGNGSCTVMIRPALEGSGITAGGSVRAVLELAGYKNVNAKMLDGSNPLNNGRAALDALRRMRTPEQVARSRRLSLDEMLARVKSARFAPELQ